MHPSLAAFIELLPEQVGTPSVVVHVLDQRILDRNAAAGGVEVGASRVEHLINLPLRVHWDELIAQAVIRGVKGKRKGDRNLLCGQLFNARKQAHC